MKKVLFLTLLILGSLTLVACKGPAVDMSDIQSDTATTTDQTNTQKQILVTETPSTPLPSTTTSKESTTMPGSSQVKTLTDFQPIEGKQVTLKTTKGDIVLSLNREEEPLTTTNFLTLAKSGFYDGILFHRVIPDFMAQAGDPNTKDPAKQAQWGQGGPGYTIEDEISPTLKHDSEGILSMANTGQPNSGGSQFFITFAPTPWLDGKHAVFGKVTSGIEVLRQITQGDKIISVSIQ